MLCGNVPIEGDKEDPEEGGVPRIFGMRVAPGLQFVKRMRGCMMMGEFRRGEVDRGWRGLDREGETVIACRGVD